MGDKSDGNSHDALIDNISLGFTSVLGIAGAVAGVFIPGAAVPAAAIQAGAYCPAIVAAVVKQSINGKGFSKKLDEQIKRCAEVTAKEYLAELKKNDPTMYSLFRYVWDDGKIYDQNPTLGSIEQNIKSSLDRENRWEATGKTPKDIDAVVGAYVHSFFINAKNYPELNQSILLGVAQKTGELEIRQYELEDRMDELKTLAFADNNDEDKKRYQDFKNTVIETEDHIVGRIQELITQVHSENLNTTSSEDISVDKNQKEINSSKIDNQTISKTSNEMKNHDTNKQKTELECLNIKENPKVFISYAWEDEAHRQWVKEFADCLLDNGIDATLDQYDLSLGDRLPEFMEKSISEAKYVLIICTPTYKDKSNNRRGGVGYEGHIISGELVSTRNERKFIPVIRKGDIEQSIPAILSGKLGIDLRDGKEYNANFEKLLNTLKGVSSKPPLGRIRINTTINSSKYRLTMDSIDIVFCIDGTQSMRTLKDIKGRAVHFYQDVRYQLERKKYNIGQIRARIILFRDYYFDGDQAMLITDFFDLPQQTLEFDTIINNIDSRGGGDDPEDGLEALAFAISSRWNHNAKRKRQIILLWSDATPHELGFGRKSEVYPKGMASDFEELTRWWNDENRINQKAKRLLLFTPDKSWWHRISCDWDRVLLFAVQNGQGLMDIEYESIISAIANSI